MEAQQYRSAKTVVGMMWKDVLLNTLAKFVQMLRRRHGGETSMCAATASTKISPASVLGCVIQQCLI